MNGKDKKRPYHNYKEIFFSGEKIILLKPMSFMNLSGEVVSSFVKYFKIDINDMAIHNFVYAEFIVFIFCFFS